MKEFVKVHNNTRFSPIVILLDSWNSLEEDSYKIKKVSSINFKNSNILFLNTQKNILIFLIFSFSFIISADIVSAQEIQNEKEISLSDKNNSERIDSESLEKKVSNQDNPSIENPDWEVLGLIVSLVVVGITIFFNFIFYKKRVEQDISKEGRKKVWELFNKFYSENYLPIRSMVWDEVKPTAFCTVPKEAKDVKTEDGKIKQEETEIQLTPYGMRIVTAYLTEKGGSREKFKKYDSREEYENDINKREWENPLDPDPEDDESVLLPNMIKEFSSGLKTTYSKHEKFIKQLHSLNLLLYFWVELDISLKTNQCDEKVAFTVFENVFWWWKKFLIPWKVLYVIELERVNGEIPDKKNEFPEPPWVKSIEKLVEFFEQGKYPRENQTD